MSVGGNPPNGQQPLKQKSRGHIVTLVYGARDEEHNEAVVLKAVLEGRK
jgi:uncharacterized protein YeaO (DUF488 family)